MAWLFLDTHQSLSSRFGWLLTGAAPEIKTIQGRSPRMLTSLARVWSTQRKDLKGICVVAGPGSFSSVRTGVLYANLLSRFLHVPLVGVSVDDAASLSGLETIMRKRSSLPDLYVAPIYDAEPNITIPRQP